MNKVTSLLLCALACLSGIAQLPAQTIQEPAIGHHDLILPQRRVIPIHPATHQERVEIEKVSARTVVSKSHAETTMDITLRNPGASIAEAEVLLPVPEGVICKSFSYGQNAGQYKARVLSAVEARQLYDRIVAQIKDPALLEFAGLNALRTSVFPIPAHSAMEVRIVYEQLLESRNGRFDYVLPRSEAFGQSTKWDIRVEIAPNEDGKAPINVYSPTHEINTQQLKGHEMAVSLKQVDGNINPGAFRLSWQYEELAGGSALAGVNVFACPSLENPDTGYFLLMCSPDKLVEDFISKAIYKAPVPREVTLVLDRSGSMRGEKLEKMKESVKQIIAGLDENELFNIITYNEGVDRFHEKPVAKNAGTEKEAFAWIDQINARGGTNIYDALSTAIRQPASEGTLPLILFLTDGLPTIGNTSEKAIVELVEKNNAEQRRIFSIGVGTDLNASLIRRISSSTGAVCTFILPKEDVEIKISDLFAKLRGPLAANISLAVSPNSGRVRDILPRQIEDLYAGTQLVITGQYVGTETMEFKLMSSPDKNAEAKNDQEEQILAVIPFDPKKIASIQDDFVPRLWATRQIAALQEALRDMGINSTSLPQLSSDPKTREIAEEIIRLSTQFGIISDYTSFFADDGTAGVPRRFNPRVTADYMGARDGALAVAQEANIESMKRSSTLNKDNSKWAVPAASVSAAAQANSISKTTSNSIYQIGQDSYTNLNGIWIQNDAKISAGPSVNPQPPTVIVGTPEYSDVVSQLVRENRQGILSIDGTVRLKLNGKTILLQNTIN